MSFQKALGRLRKAVQGSSGQIACIVQSGDLRDLLDYFTRIDALSAQQQNELTANRYATYRYLFAFAKKTEVLQITFTQDELLALKHFGQVKFTQGLDKTVILTFSDTP